MSITVSTCSKCRIKNRFYNNIIPHFCEYIYIKITVDELIVNITVHIKTAPKSEICFSYNIWITIKSNLIITWSVILQWHHNQRDAVSNHQPHDCLLNHLFRRRSKKTPNICVTGLGGGIHQSPVNSPHKAPVTRKMCPFDYVIMHDMIFHMMQQ